MIRLYTLNVRGLRNKQKRREIFEFLKRKQYDIVFIQESHSSPEIENQWEKEWGGIIKFSHFSSNARGTMTLFNKRITIIDNWNDNDGRINISNISYQNVNYTCVNIYAPNEENSRATFFDSLSSNLMQNFSTHKMIMAGDFNLTLEKEEKKAAKYGPDKSREKLKQLLQSHNLVDAWSQKNPTSKRYTWSRKQPPTMCRLDYFFVNKSDIEKCKSCKIQESIRTDHKLVYLEMISTVDNVRGR